MSNTKRKIWDVIPDEGATIDQISMSIPTITRHGLQQACLKMVKAGYLTDRTGMVEDNQRLKTYFRASSEPPSASRNYRPDIASRAREDGGKSTIALMDAIETDFLTMQETLDRLGKNIDQIRSRLITDELIAELKELRDLRNSVASLMNK